MNSPESWQEYWDRPAYFFAGSHQSRLSSEVLVDNLLGVLPRKQDCVLLDYGCGRHPATVRLVEHGMRLRLYDQSASARSIVADEYTDAHDVDVLAEFDPMQIGAGAVDYVLMNSVVQYMTIPQLQEVARIVSKILKPRGIFIVSDVIPQKTSMLPDLSRILMQAVKSGYFVDTMASLVKLQLSPYRKLLISQGLSTHDLTSLSDILTPLGFRVTQLENNIGIAANRTAYFARLDNSHR